MAEINAAEAMNREVHDIISLLSSPERDFLVRNNGDEVKIDTLKGKKLGLYFSASWCGPCHRFTPILVEAYEGLLGKGEFEVVFVSSDEDDEAFENYFSKMPWLAIPFGDSDKRDSLDEVFKVRGIPHLVIIDEAGRVASDSGYELVEEHGAEAYPFTEEHIKKLEAKFEEMAKGWPKNLKHGSHDHELVLSRRMNYTCDVCGEQGQVWSYLCEECDFDLHPNCAFKEAKDDETPEGWVCEGGVCRKA